MGGLHGQRKVWENARPTERAGTARTSQAMGEAREGEPPWSPRYGIKAVLLLITLTWLIIWRGKGSLGNKKLDLVRDLPLCAGGFRPWDSNPVSEHPRVRSVPGCP